MLHVAAYKVFYGSKPLPFGEVTVNIYACYN